VLNIEAQLNDNVCSLLQILLGDWRNWERNCFASNSQEFESLILHHEQRMSYIIQYESQGTAVNPWTSNSTYINVTGGSDLLRAASSKLPSTKFMSVLVRLNRCWRTKASCANIKAGFNSLTDTMFLAPIGEMESLCVWDAGAQVRFLHRRPIVKEGQSNWRWNRS
jgi:hypothetical protein